MKNQGSKDESQLIDRESSKVAIREDESQLTERVRESIGDESIASFSRRCGIGDSTLRKYIDGALPNSLNLVAMADTANVNIEWLAAGRGPKRRGSVIQSVPPSAAPPLDLERLEMAIETVQEAISLTGRQFTPDKHAKIISIAYQLLENAEQRDNVVGMIKMAS